VMLRVVAVSVRGPKYLVGDPTVHDIEEVPPGVGTPFASIAEVQHHVTREFRGLSVYWRVEVVDADGAVVWRGTRDGHRGTGPSWIWEETP
jgi:hypothetical protein